MLDKIIYLIIGLVVGLASDLYKNIYLMGYGQAMSNLRKVASKAEVGKKDEK